MTDKRPIKPGDLLADRYRVKRVLGQGGMGVVFAAQDQELRRPVALKVLSPSLVDDPDSAERFLREARAAVRLTGEHSVRVFDVRELDDGTRFMVMELLVGQDLDTLVMARGRPPVNETIDWILQAAEGIAEAHSYGIVHRDLKPRNLFLTRRPDGSPLVKVLDFGLAKSPRQKGDRAITSSLTVMGSPDYMSPEQLRGMRDVDGRTDIWSLGVCAYELLVGELPFAGATLPDLTVAILEKDARPPHTVNAEIPLLLSYAVMRCLAKKADERFANVADLAAALDEFGSAEMRGSAERVDRVLRRRPSIPDPQQKATVAGRDPYATTVAQRGDTAAASTMDSRPRRKRRLVTATVVSVLAGGALAFLVNTGWLRHHPLLSALSPSPSISTSPVAESLTNGPPDPVTTTTGSPALAPAAPTASAASSPSSPSSKPRGHAGTTRTPPASAPPPTAAASVRDSTVKPPVAPTADLGRQM